MKVYKVGGYVRDTLLGITPTDCDYVVVGSTPEEMLSQGYVQVGKSFPVFLHPKTHEEYALARNEIKIGHKHQDFAINANPTITLKEDLSRRDLTINAIAEDSEGNLIDPYNGIKDLREGILRHISPAFKDDPLRILRIARFSAILGFCVASETMLLLKEMANQKAGLYISRERIVRELELAFAGKSSNNFFNILSDSGNWEVFFPDLLLKPTWLNLNKLNYFLPKATTTLQKYTSLSIQCARTYDKIRLIALNKSQINYIHYTQYIYDNLTIKPESHRILELLKRVRALRNLEEFEKIINNLQWYINTDNTQEWKIFELKTLLASAKELSHIPKQLTNSKISNHDIIERIYKWQLETINNVKASIC